MRGRVAQSDAQTIRGRGIFGKEWPLKRRQRKTRLAWIVASQMERRFAVGGAVAVRLQTISENRIGK